MRLSPAMLCQRITAQSLSVPQSAPDERCNESIIATTAAAAEIWRRTLASPNRCNQLLKAAGMEAAVFDKQNGFPAALRETCFNGDYEHSNLFLTACLDWHDLPQKVTMLTGVNSSR